jgi:hypothetical protein
VALGEGPEFKSQYCKKKKKKKEARDIAQCFVEHLTSMDKPWDGFLVLKKKKERNNL